MDYKNLTKKIYGTHDGYRDVSKLMYCLEDMYEAFRNIRSFLKENYKDDFKETFILLKNHYKTLKYIKKYIQSKKRYNVGTLTSDTESEYYDNDTSASSETSYEDSTNTLKKAIKTMDKFLRRKQTFIVYTSPETKEDFQILYNLIQEQRDFCYKYAIQNHLTL
uniref:PIR Superfamily Protein n=1 Tax=Parastrongyloides trichosuri TaxID=131310 RepID=A0A0N4Z0Z6_PARTI